MKEETRIAHTRRGRVRSRCAAAFAIAATTGVVLSGCGSSSSSSGTASAAGSKTDLAYFANATVAAEKGNPTTYQGPTVKATPKPGVKIALIACARALSGCEIPLEQSTKAANAIHWNVVQLDGMGTPRGENAAILQAVASGAKVIIAYSIEPALVQQGLKAAHKAGIVLISDSNATGSPNPTIPLASGQVGFDVDVSQDFVAGGRASGDWIVSDSNGKANVMVIGDKEFDSVNDIQKGLLSELAKCGTCTVPPVTYISAAEIGPQVGQMVTSYLQQHPNINYVYAPYDPVAAVLVPAISQAGLGTKVKVASAVGAPENFNFIRTGHVQASDQAADLAYQGYAAVDQAIRRLDGQPFAQPVSENSPWSLIVKSNVPNNNQGLYFAPFDYKSKFLALWSAGK